MPLKEQSRWPHVPLESHLSQQINALPFIFLALPLYCPSFATAFCYSCASVKGTKGIPKTMKRPFVHILLVASLCVGPSSAIAGDNTFWGTGMGAALGGYLGSHIGKGDGQLAATGAGVFLGGLMGNSVGRSLDRGNASYYSRGGGYGSMSYYPTYPAYSAPYVAPPAAPPPQVIFVQPEQVDYYAPRRRAVLVEEGYVGPPPPKQHRRRHCREFTQTTRIDGQVRESYGTACLRPDGTWQIEQE
jgi:surface antigen